MARTVTDSELAYFKSHYTDMPTKDIAEKLGISKSKVYHLAEKFGLKKSKAFIHSMRKHNFDVIGLANHSYKKGNVPYTKGKKQEVWMRDEALANSCKTRFKKGNKPKHTCAIGTERVNYRGYIEVKVEDSASGWRFKHRYVWEQHYGAIPVGYNVVFKDGNKLNCDINNLHLVSDKDMMQINSIQNYPTDLVSLIKLERRIEREINEQRKQNERV